MVIKMKLNDAKHSDLDLLNEEGFDWMGHERFTAKELDEVYVRPIRPSFFVDPEAENDEMFPPQDNAQYREGLKNMARLILSLPELKPFSPKKK